MYGRWLKFNKDELQIMSLTDNKLTHTDSTVATTH